MAKSSNLALPTSLVLAALVCLAIFLWRGEEHEKTTRVPSSSESEITNQRPSKREDFSFANEGLTTRTPVGKGNTNRGTTEPRDETKVLSGDVVVSFGNVEDIGRQAGYIMPSLSEMRALAAVDPSTLSPEQRRHLLDLQRRYTDLLGVLPQIAGFQNNPAEYGKFFANMARQSAGLNESQAAQVDAYMQGRASEMIKAGFNEAKKPADPALLDAWESRRDHFNEQTVSGLRQVISPAVADRAGINDQLMEFLETDFDKAQARPDLN
jgi:hypothetical protein